MIIVALIVVISAFWVFIDSAKNNIGYAQDSKGNWKPTKPWHFALGVMILWIIFFPLYLINRGKMAEYAKTNPVTITQGEQSKWLMILAAIGFIFIVFMLCI